MKGKFWCWHRWEYSSGWAYAVTKHCTKCGKRKVAYVG